LKHKQDLLMVHSVVTYTYSGNTATFTVTVSTMQPHVNVGYKYVATVSGNKITYNGITLTKE
ncbi:MAG: hypothetical protein LBL43_07855, partial [Treponema sp.]|nr:hypothetical protein [Treponema sp.]